MQKLSQTEELARSLAAKARRHTLTPEQISRAMEETDFDVAQLDELYAALEQRGVHLAEEPAELPVLDDAQIGRLENELSSEGVALDEMCIRDRVWIVRHVLSGRGIPQKTSHSIG